MGAMVFSAPCTTGFQECFRKAINNNRDCIGRKYCGRQCVVSMRSGTISSLSSSNKPMLASCRLAVEKSISYPVAGLAPVSSVSHHTFTSYGSKLKGTLAAKKRSGRAVSTVVMARGGGFGPTPVERVVAAAPYLLPLLDGIRYGRFLFVQFPIFAKILLPLQPLMNIYFSVPFASIAAFFAIYLGIINNYNFPRYVRFNAMQAVLLDIILIIPNLLESLFRGGPMGGAGLQVYITVYNTIFLFLLACVVYGIGSCLAGTSSRLPVVGDAADQQVR